MPPGSSCDATATGADGDDVGHDDIERQAVDAELGRAFDCRLRLSPSNETDVATGAADIRWR